MPKEAKEKLTKEQMDEIRHNAAIMWHDELETHNDLEGTIWRFARVGAGRVMRWDAAAYVFVGGEMSPIEVALQVIVKQESVFHRIYRRSDLATAEMVEIEIKTMQTVIDHNMRQSA